MPQKPPLRITDILQVKHVWTS